MGYIRHAISIITCTLIVLFSTSVHAETSVWKVSKDDYHVYIGGTMHLLKPQDHPLPKPYQHAFDDADTIYFETDMEAAASPAFSAKLTAALTQPQGQTLVSTLKPKTVAALEDYFTSNRASMAFFNHLTASGIGITITMMEFMKLGFKPDLGVDHTFYTLALQENKKINTFETPDEQIEFIKNMAVGKEDEMILYTLSDVKTLANNTNILKSAWRQGDIKKMNAISLIELKRDFPEAYKSLISDRNQRWMKKILPMFTTPETEYLLVGALHLAGNDGLIHQLKSKGYKVEQL